MFMRKFAILVVLSMLGAAAPLFAQEVAGNWIGELDTGFKVRIHFEKAPTGYSGYLTNPSGNETAFDQVTFDGKHLHFAVEKLNLTFDSAWDEKEQAWNGNLNFQQIYPLKLKRAPAADLAAVRHNRPQEAAIAAQPRPYRERDIRLANPAGHNELAGTLSVPNGIGPFPAAVLISGTGHNTRDEDVWGHKVFLVLADALNRKGIAVLRYDKRGVGGSTGDYDAATTVDFTSDAEAAVIWLKMQGEIDPHRVGVLGHSEGGIIAPAVAAEDKSVAFVVMIAGPTIRGDRLFVEQSAVTAKTYGAPDVYIAKRKLFDQELYDAIIAAPSDAIALDRARAIVAKGVADKVVDSNEAATLAQEDARPWERYFLAYDPAPTLASLKVPVLVLNGSLDVQVPAQVDLAAAREALKSNPKATVLELPGMNHLLQDAKTGSPNEYNEIEETMSTKALNIIGDWVSTQTGSYSKANR
jgi:pimeloyl-ACP methyl ester carboxylesterase